MDFTIFKVVDAKGRASEWDTLAALAASTECKIVNISLAFGLPSWNTPTCGRESMSSRSAVFETIIDQLAGLADGPIIVAAAGNGSLTELSFPARFNTVLAVESVDFEGRSFGFFEPLDHRPRRQSAPERLCGAGGQQPRGAASPTEPVGTDKHGKDVCGTSFACAYASGLLAATWSDSANATKDAAAMLGTLRTRADKAFAGFGAALHGNGLLQY